MHEILGFKYLSLVLGAFGISDTKYYRLIGERMFKVYTNQAKRRNNRFLFEHFKDMYNILTFFLASQERPSCKTRVALDGRGLPSIIPFPLRELILRRERIPCMVILTLFGVHRVIGGGPKVDLSTILDDFNGISPVLDRLRIRKAIRNLNTIASTKFRFRRIMKSIELRSSGPNGKDALFQIFNDAFALLQNPRYFIRLMQLYGAYKGSLKFLIGLFVILLVFLPYVVFMTIIGKRGYLGRLAVVRNVAGKSRVVAMTNYGVQMALWPIHDSIFQYLKGLPSDGTFDQLAPIKGLMDTNDLYSSYDLSAATDRLPLDFQLQVMCQFLGDHIGHLGRDIMKIPFFYEGSIIKYSVGQPMGAYSSGASLALSHHIIVQMCSEVPVRNYAIVGDDCVVPTRIGARYLNLMNVLGVKISLLKSFLNSRGVEFAKRTINLDSGLDFSCIGPRLIFNSISNTYYKSHIILDLALRKVFDFNVLASQLRSIGNDISRFGLILLAGPSGLLMKNGLSFVDGLSLSRKNISGFLVNHPKDALNSILSSAVINEVINSHNAKVDKIGREFRMLPLRLGRKIRSLYSGPLSIVMIVLVWLTPGPYIILKSYYKVGLSGFKDSSIMTYEEAMLELKNIMFSQLDTLESRVRKDYLGSTRRISLFGTEKIKALALISEAEARRIALALEKLRARNILFTPGSHHGMIDSKEFGEVTKVKDKAPIQKKVYKKRSLNKRGRK